MEKDALMMGRHLPVEKRYGLDGRIIVKVQELKRRAYFNRKAIQDIGRLPIAPFARRRINLAAAGLVEGKMLVERANFDKSSELGLNIQRSLETSGLNSIFEVKPYGLTLSADFVAVCHEATKLRGHDLNKQMGALVMAVNEAIQAAGIGVSEESYRYMLEQFLEKAANLQPAVVAEVSSVDEVESQQQKFQRYILSIPQGGGPLHDNGQDVAMLEEVMDGISDSLADLNFDLSHLGLRQMGYQGLQKSLSGRDMLIALSSANKYLFERYLIEYLKYLLGDQTPE